MQVEKKDFPLLKSYSDAHSHLNAPIPKYCIQVHRVTEAFQRRTKSKNIGNSKRKAGKEVGARARVSYEG
jgi:hypothetical protein